MEEWEYLKESMEKCSVSVNELQAKQLTSFYHALVEKNKVMNLTAITEWDDVILKHFIDSIYNTEVYFEKSVCRIIDVGTGAGFPAIPLKIKYPDLHVTLLDSLQKRLNFLEEVIHQNDLKKVELVHSRAEDGGQNPKYRGKYDFAVSRAVANLAVLTEYCLPYVKVGGFFLAYKAGNVKDELKEAEKAIKVMGGKIISHENFMLPGTDMERTLILIKKIQNTPAKYPRKAGIPAKEPIK